MSKVNIGTTMSLDGFMNDRAGGVGKLYPDLAALGESEFLQESIRNTGAVVMGRGAYDMGQGDFTDYEYQTPIFVVTHAAPAAPPKGENERLKIVFVTDGVESAIQQAKAAAGEKDVTVVGGAATAQQILRRGLADEIHIGIMPVLLGGGLRFFEYLEAEVRLEKIRVLESGERTDIMFRVIG